jgi:hypothetical protein
MSSEIEIETTDLALDSEISEAEKNEIVFKATQDFLNSGIEIKDVFGNLEEHNITSSPSNNGEV